MCIRHFNDTCINAEIEGGVNKVQAKMDTFNDFIRDIGLSDMCFKGQTFTWSNKRRGEYKVKETLN